MEFAAGTSVGSRRLMRGARVTASKVRLRITQAPVAPAIAELGLYLEPAFLDAPTITRTRRGIVAMHTGTAAAEIRYTTDGSEPRPDSARYAEPFPLPRGGLVKARAFAGPQSGDTSTVQFGLSKARWKVLQPAADGRHKFFPHYMIDEGPASVWRAAAPGPTAFTLDLGEPTAISALHYLPPTDDRRGTVDRYEFLTSADNKTWTKRATGEFSNIRANPVEQTVPLGTPVTARYVRFVAVHTVDDEPPAVAEIGLTWADPGG